MHLRGEELPRHLEMLIFQFCLERCCYVCHNGLPTIVEMKRNRAENFDLCSLVALSIQLFSKRKATYYIFDNMKNKLGAKKVNATWSLEEAS